MWNKRARPAGVTLVELIVALVIIAVAVVGLTAALTRSNRVSADPLLQQQKIAIAEGLMGEILLKPFTPPPVDNSTPGVRNSFDDVGDFDKYGLDLPTHTTPIVGIADVDGNPVPGLGAYSVVVALDRTTPLTNIPGGNVIKITITVRRTGDNPEDAFVLTGWRTKP